MKTVRFVRIIAAVLVGEITLILLTTVAQEVLFDGISYSSSSTLELIIGGLGTFIAAVLAGIMARWVGKAYCRIVPHIISLLILAETTYLISMNRTLDPIWFDGIAGASLILGVWVGYFYKKLIKRSALKPVR